VAPGKTTTVYIKPEERVAVIKSHQRKLERMMIGITLFIFGGIALFILVPSRALNATTAWISELENGGTVSRNAATNCLDPRNKKTNYCLDRAAMVESDWKAMSKFQNGKVNHFTLTGR